MKSDILLFCFCAVYLATTSLASDHVEYHQDVTSCSISSKKFQGFFKTHVTKDSGKNFTVRLLTCLSCEKKYSNTVVAFLCPYHYAAINITQEEIQKGGCESFNRTGELCSKCNNRTSLAMSSYTLQCKRKKDCHAYHWLFFFAVEILPVTFIYIVFIIFNIKITAGYANSYILYSQFITFQLISISFHSGSRTEYSKSGSIIVIVVTLMYKFCSFQLGHPVSSHLCVHDSLDQLMSVALQYTSVFYALLLGFIGYVVVELHSHQFRLIVWISKPFSWCLRFRDRSVDPKTAALNTLAGFYYIAFAKLAAVSLFLLASTRVYNETGHVIDHVCFYDSSMSFMKGGHLKYAILAIAVLIFLVFVPVLFMVLYSFQCFRKCLGKCRLNRPGLVILMNAFQGCYKDGVSVGYNCRWFSSYYYIARLAVFSIGVFLIDPMNVLEVHLLYLLIILVSITLILWLMPYKYMLYNKLDIFIFCYCSFILSTTSYQDIFVSPGGSLDTTSPQVKYLEIIIYILVGFPLIGATLYVLEKLLGMKIRFLYRWYRHRTNREPYGQSLSLIEDTAPVPPLLRTISGISTPSLPDRMVQPEIYRFNSPGTMSPNYGSVP